eukprot:5819899-Pleurochrysis_carterae.AAC.1
MVDVWALGVALHQLVLGANPFATPLATLSPRAVSDAERLLRPQTQARTRTQTRSTGTYSLLWANRRSVGLDCRVDQACGFILRMVAVSASVAGADLRHVAARACLSPFGTESCRNGARGQNCLFPSVVYILQARGGKLGCL